MIGLLVAYAHGRVIGKDGAIPWRLPNDLRYVKRLTTGHTVVMGRKTFDSIGRPLPNRRNIVLSHDTTLTIPGAEVVQSVEEATRLVEPQDDLFVLGGESIYRQFLPLADRLYITEVDYATEGDTFFPEWDCSAFRLISRQDGPLDEKNTLPHVFYVYERKSPSPLARADIEQLQTGAKGVGHLDLHQQNLQRSDLS
jgi:dihydrofolate reductase